MLHALMFTILMGSPDSVVAAARRAVIGIRDTADARAAGYVPLAGGRDLSPFQGQHWIKRSLVAFGGDDLRKPPFLMFAPVHGRFTLVGVAYSQRLPHEQPVPDSIAGAPAMWHAHVGCANRPEQPLGLAPSKEACVAAGGIAAPRKIAMVHVWLTDNPDGPFAGEDPYLPYVAVGAPLPGPHALHDAESRHDVLQLGLALGENFGATLPAARRIELSASSDGKARLEAARAQLRAATQQFEREPGDATGLLASYATMIATYESVGTPRTVEQFKQERAAELSGSAHHHHDMPTS